MADSVKITYLAWGLIFLLIGTITGFILVQRNIKSIQSLRDPIKPVFIPVTRLKNVISGPETGANSDNKIPVNKDSLYNILCYSDIEGNFQVHIEGVINFISAPAGVTINNQNKLDTDSVTVGDSYSIYLKYYDEQNQQYEANFNIIVE